MTTWRYETEDGDMFTMCAMCVFLACDTTGELRCPACGRWYLVTHPDEELVITRLHDREERRDA